MNLQQYRFEGHEVRINSIGENLWFCAQDICGILEIRNHRQALTRLDEDEKQVLSSNVISNDVSPNRGMLYVNESGLWALVLTSRQEAAKRLSKWLRSEVIPAIRKTGVYASSDAALAAEFDRRLSNPATMADMLISAGQELKKAHKQIAEMQPKAELHDAVMSSDGWHEMSEVAKMLRLGDKGRNKLFKFLRDSGVLMLHNEPYQEHVNAGRFKVVFKEINGKVISQTLVSPKGVGYIRRLWSQMQQRHLLN